MSWFPVVISRLSMLRGVMLGSNFLTYVGIRSEETWEPEEMELPAPL